MHQSGRLEGGAHALRSASLSWRALPAAWLRPSQLPQVSYGTGLFLRQMEGAFAEVWNSVKILEAVVKPGKFL